MEFKQKIKEILNSDYELCESLMNSYIDNSKLDLFTENNITYVEVEQHGGEDEGSDYFRVLKFTNGTDVLFVQFQGWYASYHGSEYQEYFFVEPKEESRIVYSKV